ncbi:DNA-binding transcriptional ArsR family regulator [Rhizobium aquaticum]|uniref:DNA-binding transcriptional ArsR family regulator n=1 Tax=Rhizobium aquaticum TaxID=1549636 RepID=A0ABV2IYM6_9HYPH
MLNFHPKLAGLMTALSDPTRLAIVEKLSLTPLSVSEIAAPFDMSLAAIVQHIQVLEKAGAVRTFKQGRTRRCIIDTAGMAVLKNWLTDRERFWQGQFDNLEAILDAEAPKSIEERDT